MDILSVLTSVNKVALFFFILVLGFVIYEFTMYIKENRQFKKPSVPQFDPNISVSNSVTQVAPQIKSTQLPIPPKKNRLLPLIIACVILIFLGGLVIFYAPTTSKTTSRVIKEVPSVTPSPKPTLALPTEAPTIEASPSAEVASVSPTVLPSPTEVEVVVAQSTPVSSASATATATSASITTSVESLPEAGSYSSLIILVLAASTVVVFSLLF